MKQLEDRIKDRLEGYESNLPEGDLAEFKALLDASASAGEKRAPAYLAWFVPVAVAAGMALFFVFGHGPDAVELLPEDIAELAEAEPAGQVTAVQAMPSVARRISRADATGAVDENPWGTDPATVVSEPVVSEQSMDEQSVADQDGNIQKTDNAELKLDQKLDDSPFVPSVGKPVGTKVAQTIAGVLGGTGALALAGVHSPFLAKSSDSGDIVKPGDVYTDPGQHTDGRTGDDNHYMPLRAGLSLRIPFSDRWSLTTGLEYSWYASRLGYSLSGRHAQSVHYLDIPLRADCSLARNRWLDVYVGAGGSVDFCVAAYDAGRKVARDGVGFSLIGAGGIQLNINQTLGLFVEPTVSWNVPSGNRRLDTYRSEHPFMFTMSTGLRITLPVRK